MQQISYLPTEQLKLHPQNPRRIDEKQMQILCDSIKANPDYFETRPILCNKDMVVFAGNMRLLAAQRLALKEVPVAVMDISEERQRELMIRDNRSNGLWDFDLLGNNFDVDNLLKWGFNEKELLGSPFDFFPNSDKDEKMPDMPNTPPIAQLGDVYILGNHRLMCGDSTNLDDVQKLMNGQSADMLFTDPPYNIAYEQLNMMREGAKDWSKESEWKDKMTDEQFQQFLITILTNAKTVLKEFAHFYVWFAFKFYKELVIAFDSNEIHYDKVPLIWKKQTVPLSWARYHRNYEPCLFGGKETITAKNGGRWFGPNNETTVWEINTDSNISYVHPTQKPTALAERAIKNSSQENEIILDLFGGSGSTLIACEKTKRISFTMELDPHYVDVIVKRWEEYTKQTAIKA